MKYTVDTICNGVWFTDTKELPDNTQTVKKNFKKQKLVNNSQELVKDLVKEKGGDSHDHQQKGGTK